MATGAIGSAAVQLLKDLGTNVTAVCPGEHLDLVARLGADRVGDAPPDASGAFMDYPGYPGYPGYQSSSAAVTAPSSDAEADAAHGRIVKRLAEKLGAELRS